MKNKVLSILVVAVFLISTTAPAQRATPSNGNPDANEKVMKRGMTPRHTNMDFLTAEQKESAKAIHLVTAKEVKPLKNELRELEAHQQTLTTADKPDLNAIYKNIDEISEVKTNIAKIMAKQKQEFRALLNEEQLLKFDSRMDNRPHRENNKFRRNLMERDGAPMKKKG